MMASTPPAADGVPLRCFATAPLKVEVRKTNDKPDRRAPGDIAEHLQSHMQWRDPTATHWSCIDGRETAHAFCTPGGDLGELLLGLGVLEATTGTPLTEEEVATAFKQFLASMPAGRRFYFHTDEPSAKLFLDALNLPHDTDIAALSPDKHAAALKLVTVPENIGCGHSRFASSFPELYGLSATLPTYLIRTFYTILWQDKKLADEKLVFITLKGGPRAVGVVAMGPGFDRRDERDGRDLAPQVAPTTPNQADVSVFFVHQPFVHQGIRNRIASFVQSLLRSKYDKDISEKTLVDEIDKMGAAQAAQSVGRLAGDLPTYTLLPATTK